MTSTTGRKPPGTDLAEDVVRRVRADLPELVDHITQRILIEIPFYAAASSSTPDDLKERIRANIEAAVESLLDRQHDPTAAVETGRLRARQDAPLADVLTAYRIGYTEVSAAVVKAARTPPVIPAEVVIDLGQSVFEVHNRDADALMEAFRDEAQHILLQRERERAALIEVLLMDEPGLATLLDVVRALRLPMEGTFVVVAAASKRGRDPMPRLVNALSAIDISSVWQLRYDVAVGVLSLKDLTRNKHALQLLERHATGPVGVSPPFRSLRRTAWAVDLAQLVLRRLGPGPDVEQMHSSPLNMLVAGGRDASRETAEDVLGDLLTQTPDARDTLLATLQTWIELGGSAERTGEHLHCHPNSIRKRLKRIEHLTGRTLSEPGGIAEIVAALHSWQQLRPKHPTDHR